MTLRFYSSKYTERAKADINLNSYNTPKTAKSREITKLLVQMGVDLASVSLTQVAYCIKTYKLIEIVLLLKAKI